MSKKKTHLVQTQSKESKMAIVESNESIEEVVNQAMADASISVTPVQEETPVTEPIVEQVAEEIPVVEAPVVKEVVQPVVEAPVEKVVNVIPQTNDDFLIRIQIIKETGTIREKFVIDSIESYIDKMAVGKPINNDSGAKQQYNLWKLISNIIESSSNEEFNKLWNILLAYFKEYEKGVFADRYVFRFSEYWSWSIKDLNALQRILNLIKVTCDNSKRSVNVGKVDLNRTLAEGFSEEGRGRVISFYKR